MCNTKMANPTVAWLNECIEIGKIVIDPFYRTCHVNYQVIQNFSRQVILKGHSLRLGL